MARVFITGSADGLGQLAAQRLVEQHHAVVLHARDERRAGEALSAVPGAEQALVGDLSRMEEVKRLAADANATGRFAAVIHNAGVYRASGEDILAVNLLAPYVLTCLMHEPQRLIYLGSGEHWHGDPAPSRIVMRKRIDYADSKLFVLGVFMVLIGLGFKIAAFPFQIWAPDVYQGAPTPSTAFLAVGSKAAGFVLLLRVLFTAVPDITAHWSKLLIFISAVTILYGNLCALPQRNVKRLLGYSSVAQAGYLLLGIAALSQAGQSAILYYLSGYLFTVLGAFTVICLVMRQVDGEDVSTLAGLHQRNPLLAATMALSMISLAGIPPLAGFFGKFLLLKAIIDQGAVDSRYYLLAFTALAGVGISIVYYFGVVRAIYWSKDTNDLSPIQISLPIRLSLYACVIGMLYLGIFPGSAVRWTEIAVKSLHFKG